MKFQRKAKLMSAYAKGELSAETVFPVVQQLEHAKRLRQAQAAMIRQHSLKIHKADLAYDELNIDQKRAVIGVCHSRQLSSMPALVSRIRAW
jgi:hypothetical protein